MLKLIQLEYKKAQLKRMVIISILTTMVLAFWCIWSKGGHPEGYPDYHTVFAEISFYIQTAFLIIGAIFISSIVFDEYRSKTITVLFMYPHSRERIFVAKLALISMLVFVYALLANLLVAGAFVLFAPSHSVHTGVLTADILTVVVLRTFLFSFATVGITLVSFCLGMWKKSVPVLIIFPFLISIVFGVRFYSLPSITSVVIVTAGWCILGILLAYWSIKKQVTQELDL